MILNLWTNFEFSSLWNYHFTIYALKCKKSKINGCKIGCQQMPLIGGIYAINKQQCKYDISFCDH